MKRIIALFSFCFVIQQVNAQNVSAVYKTDDLLKRISSPDTLYIVNFWATWCKPCIEELPAFDSLEASIKKEESIKVILVNLNFSDELEKKVNPFLQKKQTKATCVLLDEVNGNVYIDKISKTWSGAIPATYIKTKSKAELFEKKLTYRQLRDLISSYKKN
jgi:thiol-disulfide isomerase/thioredoxin